jgi:hypothetical protein
MCPKIDVMERECKKLEVGRNLNKAHVYIFLKKDYHVYIVSSSQKRKQIPKPSWLQKLLLPLFLFSYCIRFILSQIWPTLTKFIEK